MWYDYLGDLLTMKRLALVLCMILICSFFGCSQQSEPAQIAATTLPVYEFTSRLCAGTDITVGRLITENVSCLHDYTLQVDQMRAIEGAQLVVINGGGLEDFLHDALSSAAFVADASEDISLHEGHDHAHNHGHSHGIDPHIWLSPEHAKTMSRNICAELCQFYPAHKDVFQANLTSLLAELDTLQAYGEEKLSALSCRELITFHDGFAYFAESFDLTIVKAVEEESGSEASAQTLIELIGLVQKHGLPAIFVEANGSDSAAAVIAAETGAKVFPLDMAVAGDSYFESMYHNIDTVWEALQ